MRLITRVILLVIGISIITGPAFPQKLDRIERDRLRQMLSTLKDAIRKNYYDPTYRGIDLDARFEKAEKRLDEVTTTGAGFAVIAQVLIDFNDSHLYFQPPATTVSVQYGFGLKIIGSDAYVTAVKPKSDADAKGVRPGDKIIAFEGFRPTRAELWKMIYYYYALSPRSKIRLSVLKPGASEPTELEITAKIKTKQRTVNLTSTFDVNDLIRDIEDDANRDVHYFTSVGNTAIWKMLTFAIDPASINGLVDSYVKKQQHLILDLRGNGGGYVKTLEQVAGNLFEKDLKIADRVGRPEKKKENEAMMLKSRGDAVFTGKLIVLIDSGSASASEIFARLVQLEKRGIVLGDVSAGAVMQSISHPFTIMSGLDREIYYGASITNADVIMSDGKSIEHVGVTPDELILPTAEDMANQRDPVLARALQLLGSTISPENAWKLFEKAHRWDD